MLLGPFVARPFASTTIRLINDPNYSTQQQGKGMSEDLVACWDVPMSDMVHRVEFEHGTTTGKRVLRLDGKVDDADHATDAVFALCPVTHNELIAVVVSMRGGSAPGWDGIPTKLIKNSINTLQLPLLYMN
ncbi:uncharacterized protein LOC111051755 isoform X5 [Nilaparvata lugens]|uniref:uncharacterized protein LOC111051755 isoform X5 n=1 Tax=Nilaparvata lugens TaxID=108931 RepID=UPI00193E300E|nr:uncharacterized protein LOC111051755 isoform X5 [Nilaparvata lugens]